MTFKNNTLILNEFTNLFVISLNSDNNLVWIIISIVFSLFYLQVLEILDLQVLDFWLFIEFSILGWFSTWCFKHSRIPVSMNFRRNNSCRCVISNTNHTLSELLVVLCRKLRPFVVVVVGIWIFHLRWLFNLRLSDLYCVCMVHYLLRSI